MCPEFFSIILGKNSFTVKAWLIVFTLIVFSIICKEFCKSFFPETIPALLIKISTSPKLYLA